MQRSKNIAFRECSGPRAEGSVEASDRKRLQQSLTALARLIARSTAAKDYSSPKRPSAPSSNQEDEQ